MAGDEDTKKSKTMDSTSPYYIHPGDNPGVNICGMTLKGEANYDEWVKAMRNAFKAKRKAGFIDGIIEKLADDSEEIEDWWSVNSMLVHWIMIAIDPAVRSTLTYMDNVKDLWDDLKERFSVGDSMRIHQLREAIKNCKQEGQTVSTYFGKLKAMWEELAGYVKVPTCRCGGCTCGLAKEYLEEREKEKTHDFLTGLDSALYGNIRSNILSNDPLPSLNRAYALVIQEERHKQVTRARDERADAVGFAVHTAARPQNNQFGNYREQLVCSNCKKAGHDVKECFKLIGYPKWWSSGRGGGHGNSGRGGSNGRHGTAGRGRGTWAIVNAAQTLDMLTVTLIGQAVL